MSDIVKVSRINQFSKENYLMFFSGKDYSDSMRLAEEWAKRKGVTIEAIYEQVAFKKSILISYKPKSNGDNS